MGQKEKQCLIEVNNMNNKVQLYKYLLSLGKSEVYLKELNPIYSPLEIGSRIGVLIDEGLITVNWENKTISIEGLNIEGALQSKDKLSEYSRKVPEYMKAQKQEINKPYLSKNKSK